MSVHKSLVPKSLLKRHRNVLSRTERIEKLKQAEKWDEEKGVFGLAKVRNIMVKAKSKEKKEGAADKAAEGASAKAAESKGK